MIYTVTLNPALDREYVVPELAENTVLRASAVNVDFGGKGFNVSRMLASLGRSSIALGFVGGNTGQVLSDGLRESGINTDFVEVNGETRINTGIFETNGSSHIKVNEAGPAISETEINQLLKKINQLAKPGDWWVLAGSLPPGVPSDLYARMIRMINSAGGKSILDTSGESLKLGLIASPYMIKPNVFEVRELTKMSADSLNQMRKIAAVIHEMGVKKIVISAGKEMALFSTGEVCWKATPPQIEEANPIGAGDAMLAGIVFGLDSGEADDRAFAWGIAAGAAAARQPGTSIPTRSDVELLLNNIKVEEVQGAI
jgi:1-phosphofructokinase family hexose kinase